MSEPVDVLLTCVGRKSYLIDIFDASDRLGDLATVDADREASVQFFAPTFRVVPRVVSEPERYIDALVELADDFGLDCIIPQNDLDLIPIAEARERLRSHGCEIACAPADVTRSVGDKLAMAEWMADRELPYPATWKPAETPADAMPVVVKSRRGQGSARFDTVESPSDLAALDAEEVVTQRRIEGTEYNLDILRTAGGDVVSVVPKEKLEMRWGATNKAQSVDDDALVELGLAIGRATRHVGSIDVDVMIDDETGERYVLDINPRVGGGFPFTSHYCPRYVDAFLAICNGEEPDSFVGDYRAGVRVDREFRYFEVDAP